MEIQISSGQGPLECELAVGKLADSLVAEFKGAVIKRKNPGAREGCFKSVVIESEHDISFLEGTVKWICQSPFRPNHKRKNWFVDVSVLTEQNSHEFDDESVRFETFRSGGKGGQNVNKVETGVRAVYSPLGLSTVSTDERTQHMNKKLALKRLRKLVSDSNTDGKTAVSRSNWMEHNRLVRGDAVRVYEGLSFRLTTTD